MSANEEIGVQAAAAVPDIWVKVREGNTVVHGGEHHGPGDEFEVEGPTAASLMIAGHVFGVEGPTKGKK